MALMAAAKQTLPRPVAGTAPTPVRHSRMLGAYRRPQCTHTTMDRVQGVACSMCARVPDIGWVYQCRQDHRPHQDDPLPDIDSMPTMPDDSGYFDIKARIAEHLKMSPSIVRGIRSGEYDFDQVDKLIAQRENAIETIKAQEVGSRENTPVHFTAPAGSASFHGQKSALPPTTPPPAITRDSLTISQPAAAKCNFNICAGCRPYFVDRLWASFESMLATQAPLTVAEAQRLPVVNANIARTIGLRPTPESPPTTARSHQGIDSFDGEAGSEISVDWSATESESGGSEPLDKSELFACPGPLQCPVWSRNSGCAYDNGGFDDGKRAETHGFGNSITPEHSRSQLNYYTYLASSTPGASSTTASTVSLPATPTAPTAPLVPLLPTDDTFEVALEKELKKTPQVGRRTYLSDVKHYDTGHGMGNKDSRTSLESNASGAAIS